MGSIDVAAWLEHTKTPIGPPREGKAARDNQLLLKIKSLAYERVCCTGPPGELEAQKPSRLTGVVLPPGAAAPLIFAHLLESSDFLFASPLGLIRVGSYSVVPLASQRTPSALTSLSLRHRRILLDASGTGKFSTNPSPNNLCSQNKAELCNRTQQEQKPKHATSGTLPHPQALPLRPPRPHSHLPLSNPTLIAPKTLPPPKPPEIKARAGRRVDEVRLLGHQVLEREVEPGKVRQELFFRAVGGFGRRIVLGGGGGGGERVVGERGGGGGGRELVCGAIVDGHPEEGGGGYV